MRAGSRGSCATDSRNSRTRGRPGLHQLHQRAARAPTLRRGRVDGSCATRGRVRRRLPPPHLRVHAVLILQLNGVLQGGDHLLQVPGWACGREHLLELLLALVQVLLLALQRLLEQVLAPQAPVASRCPRSWCGRANFLGSQSAHWRANGTASRGPRWQHICLQRGVKRTRPIQHTPVLPPVSQPHHSSRLARPALTAAHIASRNSYAGPHRRDRPAPRRCWEHRGGLRSTTRLPRRLPTSAKLWKRGAHSWS